MADIKRPSCYRSCGGDGQRTRAPLRCRNSPLKQGGGFKYA